MDRLLKYAPIAFTGLSLVASEHYQPISVKNYNVVFEFQVDEYYEYIKPIQLNPYSDTIQKVTSFLNLGLNWDGYQAVSPTQNAIINTTRFINSLPSTIVNQLGNDSITPTPYGTIVIDFRNKNDLVSVEIGDKQIGFFTEFQDNFDINIEGRLFNQENLPSELISAFSKLYKESFS